MAGRMEEVFVAIEDIYVPAKRRREVDSGRVAEIAESILENGLQQPIQIRRDDAKNRYVLVAGLQRLEAMKALGEVEIPCLFVQARRR